MVKNSFLAFDESIELELNNCGISNIQSILDYLVYKNQEGIITCACFKKIADSQISDMKKKIIKGSLEIRDIQEDDLNKSIVSCLNFESQFKPITLITKKDSTQLRSLGLKNVVKIVTFKEASQKINEDEDFFVWKSSEIWKIQKFTD